MAGLIQLSGKDYSELSRMSKERYKLFLQDTMNNFLEQGTYDRYKVVKDKQYFRFFIYPPVIDGIEYIESDTQRDGRVELLNTYRDNYNKSISDERGETNPIESGEWITASAVEDFLGITRRTLYNIVDDENSELIMESHGKELKILKTSLINYTNNRHIVATDIGFESLYKKMRTLMSKGPADKESDKQTQIEKILTSKTYEILWAKYFQTVPDGRRVYKERIKETVEGFSIFSPRNQNISNYFEIYNPNVMISSEKLLSVPKMYSVNHIAALLDTTPRTILRYCEYGYLPYFKIGGKYMFSMDDFTKGKETLLTHEKQTKKNVGRKRKLELVLMDNDLFSEEVLNKYKGSPLEKMKNIYNEIESLSEKEESLAKLISKLKNKDSEGKHVKERREKLPEMSIELKELRAKRNSLEKIINSLRREFFNDNLREFEEKHKEIVERIFERKKTIQKLKGYSDRKKDKSFSETMNVAVTKLEQEIRELKGKLLQELI